jgi:Tfp pilus assembly protein PilF
LSEHDGGVYRRLTQLLLESGELQKALESATAALHADVESPDTHVLLAKTFEAMKNPKAATAAFETALLCPAEPDARTQVHLEFANYLERQGDVKGAQRQRDAAKQLDPNSAATPH